MKNQVVIRKYLALVLVLAFLAAPALDSLECGNCRADAGTKVHPEKRLQFPHAPSLACDNTGPKGNHENDRTLCPFCFLNVFGLIAAPPGQTLFPSLCFQTPAVPKLISIHPFPFAKPPRS